MTETSAPSLVSGTSPSESSANATWGYDPGFSPFVTALAAIVFCACAGLVTFLVWSSDGLDRIALPERALSLMVGRTMDLEGALKRAPAWEQTLSEWVSGGDVAERAEAVAWYEELAGRTADPSVHLHLAVLLAETGGMPKVERRTKEWARREPPFPLYARVLRVAYLKAPVDPEALLDLQAGVADALPAGWFYDRLAMRLAQRQQDQAFLDALEATAQAREDRLMTWARAFSLVELIVLVVGTLVLIRAGRGADSQWLRVSGATLPPPWPGRIGAHVLLRGGAVGAVLMLMLIYYGGDHPLLRMVAVPLTNLPLLVLAQRHLLEPAERGFRDGFGLRPSPGRGGRLWLAVPALVAAGLVGEWLVGRIAEPLSLSSHWTEWFDGDLVWAPTPILLLSLLEYVVFAPIFEELAFRGLLFGALRRRYAFGTAAVLSAGIFSMAHGYGVLGFLGVFWSGLVWAWGYEKTGSLLPGMIAHGINNLFVCLSVIALLRS